jgi:hypothetical protein
MGIGIGSEDGEEGGEDVILPEKSLSNTPGTRSGDFPGVAAMIFVGPDAGARLR